MDQVNLARLKRCMRQARRGGELAIAFFGGSITQDCAASVHENCYAYRVFQWWEKAFPIAKFHYVNAGIGGTSSHFGAARAVPDLLMYQPDFVVVDFSVNDVENGLLAGEIIKLLEDVKARMDEPENDRELPAPMAANSYEHARRLTIREICPALNGFRADTEEKSGHLDCFKNGWIGQKPGDSIRFEVDASCIAVQYRKTIHHPALSALLVLDGDAPILLDGNFGEEWGDCLWLEPVLHGGQRGKHTVEITVTEAQGEGLTPFYLLSLIVA